MAAANSGSVGRGRAFVRQGREKTHGAQSRAKEFPAPIASVHVAAPREQRVTNLRLAEKA